MLVLIMSEEEVLGSEVSRLRGYLDRLWSLTKSEKLDRKECLNVVSDIGRSFNAIFNTITLYFSKELAKGFAMLYPQELANYRALSTITRKELVERYTKQIVSIKNLLEDTKHYSDEAVINII